MICSICGSPVPADARHCVGCGAATIADASTPRAPGAAGAPDGRTVGRTAFLIDTDKTIAGEPPAAVTVDAPGPLTVGEAFGSRYHIIRLLGAGGMGAVYHAWDAELGVAVALKVIRVGPQRGASADAEQRFKQELLLARQVTHKHVVRIHDLGEINGIKYLTMPYVQGDDLATLLNRGGALPRAEALRLARQMAEGLQAAHDAGVVHRDLKPANIMVSGESGRRHALVMDFGISASTGSTPSGTIVGTLEYMAPEQARGRADARSDVYAFGLILYEMLTGPATSPEATPQARIDAMRRRTSTGLPSLRSLDVSIPEPLDTLVMRCVALDPAQRFRDAGEVVAALARLDDTGRLIPIARRLTRRMVVAAGVVLLALVAGTYYTARRLAVPPPPHDPVSVVIADFQNNTHDPAFDHTLEPMLRRALEGAGFINAYDRTRIRPVFGVRPPADLTADDARQIALKQGVSVVLSGSIAKEDGEYVVSARATQTTTGKVIAEESRRASSEQDVLGATARLSASVRTALGDKITPADELFARAMSATSLDVVHYYTAAIDALSNGNYTDAQQDLEKTLQLDPNFGLGYQGMAVVSRNMGKLQAANTYINDALRHLDGMSERERLGTRGLYYRMTGDYQECVKENGQLIARYAADIGGHNQRALCLSKLREMPAAVDEMKKVVKLVPNRVIYRDNLALYSNYAGDFQAAEQEVRAIQNPDVYATLALAFAQFGEGRLRDAANTYEKLKGMSALGASFASSGLADLALYRGQFSEAARLFDEGAAADLAAGNPDKAARKLTSLAYTQLAWGRPEAAIAAANRALGCSQTVPIRFLAGRILAQAGAMDAARKLATGLAGGLAAEPQAFGKIVEANVALETGDARGAIGILTGANGVLDTWLGHFDLGRAYLAAGALPQADSEFDRCIDRRGEALALLVDEEPTSGEFPPVYDYQGRVREALRTEGFAASYRKYLDIRGSSTEDPRVADIRRHASA